MKFSWCAFGGPSISSITFCRASSTPRPLLIPSDCDLEALLFYESSLGPSDCKYASICLVKFFCFLILLASCC